MADITASTAARDFIASRLTTASGVNYFATLHGAGGSAITAGSAYAASGIGELSTANGYTAGGVKLGTAVSGTNPSFAGAATAAAGVIDFGATAGDGDAIWNTTGGQTLTSEYQALWVSTAATLDTTAKLVCLKDSDQVGAGAGGYVKASFNNTITIPTPT